MTTITNRTHPLPVHDAPSLDALGPEGQLEAILVELQSNERADDAAREAANERRFEAAEEAIEERRRASRFALGVAVAGGIAKIAQGTAGLAQGFGARAGAVPGDGGPELTETAGRVRSIAGAVETSSGAASGLLDVGRQRASDDASAAELASKRAEERAMRLDGNARDEREMRNALLQALEQLADTRRRGDDAVFGPR